MVNLGIVDIDNSENKERADIIDMEALLKQFWLQEVSSSVFGR